MKKIIMLVVILFCVNFTAYAQSSESVPVVSDEFNFIAFFPAQPTQTEGDINTKFGKGYSRKWTLELPDILYEVSVEDFPELSVNMDYKSLNSFYDLVCNDFGNHYGAKIRCGSYGLSIDFFDEYGKMFSHSSQDLTVIDLMYLAQQRLYQVKVVMQTSLEKDKQISKDVRKFWGDFVFVYRKENEKKYHYGLPESFSQNLKRQANLR